MAEEILYLDSYNRRNIRRALSREGSVSHAKDINEALLFIADRDYQYFFVDADTPQAQAFIKHLRHDPQLAPPRAVVLLTENDNEDCEAWGADTFLNKSRIYRDLPYIFSHLRTETTESARILSFSGGTRSGGTSCPESAHAGARLVERENDVCENERAGVAPESRFSVPAGSPIAARDRSRTLRIAAVVIISAAIGLWIFTIVSPRGGSTQRQVEPSVTRRTRAEASTGLLSSEPALDSAPVIVAGDSVPVTPGGVVSSPSSATGEPVKVEETVTDERNEKPVADVTPEVVRAPEAIKTPVSNSNPSVSVNGPTQVLAKQTVTYTASAADPDGDSLSYSWGGASTSRSWSAPGLYTVSVTVTDSRGAASSASISVRVI